MEISIFPSVPSIHNMSVTSSVFIIKRGASVRLIDLVIVQSFASVIVT